MATIQTEMPIDLTDDEARAGVTGHHVRYVLAYGLLGIVAAFAGIGIYYGYDRLLDAVAAAASRDPVTVIWEAAPYALTIGLGATVAALLFGLWTLAAGRSDNATQTGMRLRVVLQFSVVCVLMAMLYLTTM